MTDRPWSIDPGLAADLAAGLGWRPDDGVAALTARIPARVPCGSTAKVAAVGRGEVPPGADVDALARSVVAHLAAWDRRPAEGVPSPSWSCWVVAGLQAAVLEGAGVGPVQVAATRRIDDGSPVVDLHSAVVVEVDDTTLVCDPYFGLTATLPDEVGEAAGSISVGDELGDGAGLAVACETGGRWTADVRLPTWARALRYRLLAPSVDRGDVLALCAVSAVHSGVPSRPYARLHVDGAVIDARQDDGAAGIVRVHPGPRPGGVAAGTTTTVHRTWPDAADRFVALTGVRIT